MRISPLFLALCIITIASACVKDKPNPSHGLPYSYTDSAKVLMVHEGMLGTGAGDLFVWVPSAEKMYERVFQQLHGKPIGDVFQDICRIENQYFAAVNNSNFVAVLDRFSLQIIDKIPVESPRYLLPLSSNSVWVSSIFSNKISIIDTRDFEVKNEIELPYGNSDKMLLHQGKVYVTCWHEDNHHLYVIDPLSQSITDSIDLGIAAPQTVLADYKDRLWVFYGNVTADIDYGLMCIDPDAKTTLNHFLFDAENAEVLKPTMNKNRDSLYWIGIDYRAVPSANGVFRMDVDAASVPADPFFPMPAFQYLFALGISPLDESIYLGNPKSFLESSEIIILDAAGIELRRMQTGMGIGSFYFD